MISVFLHFGKSSKYILMLFSFLVNTPNFPCSTGVGSSFHKDTAEAAMDLTQDDEDTQRQSKALTRWDRKKKKYVGVEVSCSFYFFVCFFSICFKVVKKKNTPTNLRTHSYLCIL